MAVQLSVDMRNAIGDALETTLGTSPRLQLRTGSAPADCAASDSGSLLAELVLPSDWWNDAASAQKTKKGTWSGNASADGDMTGGHWRLKTSAGVCKMQDGIASLNLSSLTIVNGGLITVTAFTWTSGNP